MESKTIDIDKYIPYGRQWVDEDDIRAVCEVLRSDYLTTGPKIAEFEQNMLAADMQLPFRMGLQRFIQPVWQPASAQATR